eukprot:681965-Pleurochrysis_carterae.AAC.1
MAAEAAVGAWRWRWRLRACRTDARVERAQLRRRHGQQRDRQRRVRVVHLRSGTSGTRAPRRAQSEKRPHWKRDPNVRASESSAVLHAQILDKRRYLGSVGGRQRGSMYRIVTHKAEGARRKLHEGGAPSDLVV